MPARSQEAIPTNCEPAAIAAGHFGWDAQAKEELEKEMIRTIEIDDASISSGWEPVAFRVPLESDHYVVSTAGLVMERGSAVPDGPRLIVRPISDDVTLACRGQIVLVSNIEKGPYEQRMLVDISPVDRNYPYICEAIDHRLPHQCWRFAKRVGK